MTVARAFDWSIRGVALVLGALYAWLVIPGLPYDEPSHWSVVQLMARTHVIPDLHRPGTTYEAQQGPVAYALDSLAPAVVIALDVWVISAVAGLHLPELLPLS